MKIEPKTRKVLPYLRIPPIGDIERNEITIVNDSKRPDWLSIKPLLAKHFDEPMEHVNVLYEGKYCDMFVGETSSINRRHIMNIRATAIYRNNWLTHNPGTDPASLPAIAGPAVLFPHDKVWA